MLEFIYSYSNQDHTNQVMNTKIEPKTLKNLIHSLLGGSSQDL